MSTYVRVRIGNESYALPVEHVQEVVRLGLLTPIPGAGPTVLGIFNLRGEVIAVFDLALVLGLTTSGQPQNMLIVHTTGKRIGLAVDDVSDVAELSGATEQTDSRLLGGAALVGDELVGFIDVPALFEALQERQPV
jgi:purine-binding chemotaxis protein CheW